MENDLKKYVVKHKFTSNLAFNFIDANLYADKLSTTRKNKLKTVVINEYKTLNRYNTEINQLTEDKVNFAYYNENNSKFSVENKKYDSTILKLDFNFNQCLTSENILDFFKYLQNYNEFYFNTETNKYKRFNPKTRNDEEQTLSKSSDYYNKIKSHYIKSIDDIPNIPLKYSVYPDAMFVTEEFKVID